MDEIVQLQKESNELKNELALLKADFLKKCSCISRKKYLAKTYRFIEEYQDEFGLVWLLEQMKVYPTAFYNYQKSKTRCKAGVERNGQRGKSR